MFHFVKTVAKILLLYCVCVCSLLKLATKCTRDNIYICFVMCVCVYIFLDLKNPFSYFWMMIINKLNTKSTWSVGKSSRERGWATKINLRELVRVRVVRFGNATLSIFNKNNYVHKISNSKFYLSDIKLFTIYYLNQYLLGVCVFSYGKNQAIGKHYP